MPIYKRIVCLANSRKRSGRCIAGKELNAWDPGGWIRPVSMDGTGELLLADIRFKDGEVPQLLDIIVVPLIEHATHDYQTENYVNAEKHQWVKVGVLPHGALCGLQDNIDTLWINGYHSRHGYNDRIPDLITREEISSSLALIKPSSFSVIIGDEMNKRKVSAEIIHKGVKYRLKITDSMFEEEYLMRSNGYYRVNCRELYLCISISEPFNGYCYKLVASVIRPNSFVYPYEKDVVHHRSLK